MQITKPVASTNIHASLVDQFHDFAAARQEMLRAWHGWIETRPPLADIEEELEGSLGALWGVAATVMARPAGSQ